MGRDTESGLAVLALVALARTLGDDDALFTNRRLALVALHQILAVTLALFADRSTAVFFSAAVTDNIWTEAAGFLLAHGVASAGTVLLGVDGGGSGFLAHDG